MIATNKKFQARLSRYSVRSSLQRLAGCRDPFSLFSGTESGDAMFYFRAIFPAPEPTHLIWKLTVPAGRYPSILWDAKVRKTAPIRFVHPLWTPSLIPFMLLVRGRNASQVARLRYLLGNVKIISVALLRRFVELLLGIAIILSRRFISCRFVRGALLQDC